MSMLAVDGHMQTLVWMLVKVSALQAAGAVVYAVLGRHRSAATRHLIWTITVVGLLLLPMLAAWLPRWQVPLRLIGTTHPSTHCAELPPPYILIQKRHHRFKRFYPTALIRGRRAQHLRLHSDSKLLRSNIFECGEKKLHQWIRGIRNFLK